MTEDEAHGWISQHCSSAQALQLERLAGRVLAEAPRQNLIAPSTIGAIFARHIVDSAQLLALAPKGEGSWIDIGTGAGFPGLVIACLSDRPVTLVEPRSRRAEFLTLTAGALGLSAKVTVLPSKIEHVRQTGAVISARAVAPLQSLIAQAAHCAQDNTVWLLPKGRSAREEVAQVRQTWHGSFHVEHSVTDPDGLIVVASKVSRR